MNEHGAHDVLWSMYFNIPSCRQCVEPVKLPSNCYITCGPYFELDYDESIQHAKKLFTQIYEHEEFLPRAPDPDEILIEGDNPTDPLPSVMAELDLDLPRTVDEPTANQSTLANEPTESQSIVQNDTQPDTQ